MSTYTRRWRQVGWGVLGLNAVASSLCCLIWVATGSVFNFAASLIAAGCVLTVFGNLQRLAHE